MSRIHMKPGVNPTGLKAEALTGIAICASVFGTLGLRLTITSLNDGRHMPGSLHYEGLAWDVRSRDEGPSYAQWSDTVKAFVAEACRRALGPDYDVVVESDHFHMEYDPKGGAD